MSQDTFGSAHAGSPQNGDNGTAQPDTVPKSMYSELESKLGSQGQELGEYREFFRSIEPLLNKLEEQPELARAIVDGKIDQDLIKSVSEGRISLGDAETATQAKADVEKRLGNKAGNVSAEEMSELIAQQIDKLRKETEDTLNKDREMREFESRVEKFISETSDFEQHAAAIHAWLDEHPNIDDIAVAYYAVKGKLSEQEARQAADADTAAQAKQIALMATGGASTATAVVNNEELVDALIQGNTTPNRLF